MKQSFGQKAVLALIVLLFTTAYIPETPGYPVKYFRSPVDYQILLSGSFGEIRRNHFHSGIDIRTGGAVGKPLYAVADGYVSRVFVAAGGFGKALYINHPNGYTSVYGHIQSFGGPIGIWVKNQQYKKEDFELDMAVEKDLLKVKKGDLVAYSGNSGASGGPHLHFELRDTKTQETINPVLFGIPVRDAIPPSITGIRIYPKGENSLVNFSSKPVTLTPALAGGSYTVKEKDTVKVSGNVIFGIRTHDFIDGNGLKTGITGVDLYVDTALVFSSNIERFPFSMTRFVNSTIDYPAMVNDDQKYILAYVVAGNKLPFYSHLQNRGMVNFSGNKAQKIVFLVRDAAGNKTRISFWVKSHPPLPGGRNNPSPKSGTLFTHATPNSFQSEGIRFDLPADAVYEDMHFQYSVAPQLPGTFTPVHSLHNNLVPLQSMCDLVLTPRNLSPKYSSKAVIARVEGPGKFSSKGGKFENGQIKAQIREFGKYTIVVDTTPPVIRPGNITNGKKMGAQRTIIMKMSDNLSGIRYYRGTLNGKWILMDYDAKSAMITYVLDDRMKPGKNTFRFVVRDAVGNESTYQAEITR